MMAKKKLELQVSLDTQKAKADQKTFEKDIKQSTQKIGESYDLPNKKILGLGDSLKKTASTGKSSADALKSKFADFGAKAKEGAAKIGSALVSAFKKGGVAVAALSVAVVGLKKTLEELTVIQSEEARNKAFGVSTEQAKAFNKELGFALSQRQALQEVAKLKGAGFSDEEVQSVAKLVKPLEVMGLLSKQAALEIARTGNVSEEVLNAFGLSTQKVDFELNNVVMTTGQVPKQLDRAKVAMRLIQAQAEKYRGTWEKIGTTSPIDRLFARLKDLKDTVFKRFAEAVDKNSKVFDSIAQDVPKIAAGIVNATAAAVKFARTIKEAANDSEFFQSFLRGFDKVYTVMMKKMDKDYIKPLSSGLAKEISDELESLADSQGLKKAVEKTVKKIPKRKPPKGVSLEAQEAQADFMGKQSEFRNQMRNFLQFYLNNISTLGGALSGIISASKDLPEQLRVLTTDKKAVEALKLTKGLTEEKIILMHQEGALTLKQVKAALLMKQISKAGKLDLEEKIQNQMTVTKELQAQALASERLGQLASFEKQAKDLDVEITKSQKLLKLSLLGIDLQRFELEKKQSKARKQSTKDFYQQQINALDVLKRRFNDANKVFTAQAKAQKEAIDLAQWRVEYAKDILDPLTAQNEKQKTTVALAKELVQAHQELQGLNGKQDEFQARVIASKIKEKELDSRIAELRVQLLQQGLQSQIAMAMKSKEDLAISQMKEKSLSEQINTAKTLKAAQEDITKALTEQSTPLGRFVQGFRSAFQTIQGGFKHLAQTFGEVWGNTLNTGLSGLQSFVGEYFKSLITMEKVDWGQKLGQGFLELLAGIASKFGSVFAAIGAGYIAMGNVGQGIASIAAAGGLFALAGLLSGISSVSDKASGGASKSGGGRTSTPPPAITAPPPPNRKEREVFVVINSAPFLGDQGEQARKFAKWAKQNKRVLGAVMP